jgi:hypothetical protein
VVFNEEEITDEKIAARQREFQKQIDRVRLAVDGVQKLQEKFADVEKTDKRKYRKARWKTGRARIEVSRAIRRIEFTEMVKRRLIEGIKQAVEDIQAKQREVRLIDQKLDPKGKRKVREEEKKIYLKHKEGVPQGNPRDGAEAGAAGRRADDHLRTILEARPRPNRPRKSSSKPTSASSSRSRRSTRTAGCSSST